MSDAEHLWQLNNEYRQLLSKLRRYLDLLEQLLIARRGESSDQTLGAVQRLRQQVGLLTEEHRRWRYSYFYETTESKRMVQSERAVTEALFYFATMSARHEQALRELDGLMRQTPRPAPSLTHVPTGDLWVMLRYALDETTTFIDGLNQPD